MVRTRQEMLDRRDSTSVIPWGDTRMSWTQLLFAVISLAAPAVVAAQGTPETWEAFKQPGGFITALCATDDALWIGTEDKGLWRLITITYNNMGTLPILFVARALRRANIYAGCHTPHGANR